MAISLEHLSPPFAASDVDDLSVLLRDAVEGGASVGFMLPLTEAAVRAFWSEIESDIAHDRRVVLVARDENRIIGSVQLGLATRPNSLHRGEVQKLLVLRSARGHGIGGALMHAAEEAARKIGRTLLVLDTSATGNAHGLYDRCGYTRVGTIPRFARDPDGPFIDTVVYFKDLESP